MPLVRLLDALAPPACVVCRAPVGEVLCRMCRARLAWIADPCPRCALPRRGGMCTGCPAARAAFAAAWAPVAHTGAARDLVLALKLRGALPAASVMAAQIAARAPRWVLEDATLVPVPGSPARRRRRGFDPAERLAVALARRTGLPVAHCLHRSADTRRQLGRSRRARLAGGRIEFARNGDVPSQPLLIDDVHTTGATLDACARALRSAGSPQVRAVTYVRTLTGA